MNAKELAEQIMAEALAEHGLTKFGEPKLKPVAPKPAPPPLRLVSEAAPVVDLEEMRATNRRREAKLAKAEKLEVREHMRKRMEYRKRYGRFPPATAAEALRRKEEAEQIARQQALDYHMEMKLFHEAEEREIRRERED